MSNDTQFFLLLILCGVLFGGDPDLVDALIIWLTK
jgi:hypothetical protein